MKHEDLTTVIGSIVWQLVQTHDLERPARIGGGEVRKIIHLYNILGL